MADFAWPAAANRTVIGKEVDRIDAKQKVSGRATYTTDVRADGLLHARTVRSPFAHARVVSIDTSAAEQTPGFKAVVIIRRPGSEIRWAGDSVVAIAAVDEFSAEQCIRAVKVQYQELPHLVIDSDPNAPGFTQPMAPETAGNPDQAFQQAAAVVENTYSMPVITHCCLEPHGSVITFRGGRIDAHISTQSVSAIVQQMSTALGVPAAQVHVTAGFEGGGFGAKLSADSWGLAAARLSQLAGGAPVRLVLDRREEQEAGGCRPSAFGRIKAGADASGRITAWDSTTWATGGPAGGGQYPLPYMFQNIPNQRLRHTSVFNNIGPARTWRAPNHPQACMLTMCALDDLADKLHMDPFDFFKRNLSLTPGMANLFQQEFDVAAGLMKWKQTFRLRNQNTSSGPVRRGLGMAFHVWDGAANSAACDVTIHPDGSVSVTSGTQDIGTGTRTVMAIVAAESLGQSVEDISIQIGDSAFVPSPGSGGSGTVGGIGAATRRAAVRARSLMFAKIAPGLAVQAADIRLQGGRVIAGNTSLTWKQATARLGALPVTARGVHPDSGPRLTGIGATGVQMADVSVDIETGVVTVNKIVAVQDCGLIINRKAVLSQCYGSLIMGVGYALYEEKIMDQSLGQMLNPNMEFYRLAGIGDRGKLVVELMSGPGFDERGVIGCGEPAVISTGAAISNAVANAIGVRVPAMPLTPDRLLAALGGS
jgi:xanthine dehydrogenase YagR molybdenum-binding subunit